MKFLRACSNDVAAHKIPIREILGGVPLQARHGVHPFMVRW
jgi:hypothetical protein